MNRVICGECGEVALHSPELAERLEGRFTRCPHCDSVGRIVLRDDDQGGLASIELVAQDEPKETP